MALSTVQAVRLAHEDLRAFFNVWMKRRAGPDAPEYGVCECRICREAV